MRGTLPALYATEEIPSPDKTCHVHFFCAVDGSYLVEFDAIERHCFGYVFNRSRPESSE